ncbi:type I secretion system permease/ATPase [Cereibacter sp. SYSU M97828]|nr:type I secretion system permease/ATPase [Cereibacter flavus]
MNGKKSGAAAPSARHGNSYRQALRALRGLFLGAGALSAIINVLMLTGSIYMLQVYDRVLPSGSVPTLQGLFLIVILLYAFLGFYDFLRARILARAAVRLDNALGPVAFRQWLRSGQKGENALPLRDLEIMRGFMSGPAIHGLFDLPWIPIYLAVLFLIHPWLGWLTVGGAAVVAIAAWVNRLMTQGGLGRSMAMDATARAFADQSLRSAETVQALGMEGRVATRWQGMHEDALAAGQRGSDVNEVTSAFSKSFRMLLQSAMLTLGAFLVLRHEITAGMIIATSILSGRALAPVDQVIGQWRAIGRAGVAHRRLSGFFDSAATPRAPVDLPAPTGRISVRGLTKLSPNAAPGSDRARMLHQVGFELSPGDGLGVIGNSAAGKSTLARLLVGAWAPDGGEIRLDGATPDQWAPEALGRSIGYLPQAVEMLPGTIRDNITRFDPEASDAKMIEAAKISGVHDMILGLPMGYETRIGAGEQPLSGGQIQRLGLVRAVYGDPKIIVLDEPNSNLDAGGEQALAQTIRAMRERGSTVIVMAHRPSALAAVNKILVLQNGMVLKFGDKEEVLRAAMPPRPVPTAPATTAPPANEPVRLRASNEDKA